VRSLFSNRQTFLRRPWPPPAPPSRPMLCPTLGRR